MAIVFIHGIACGLFFSNFKIFLRIGRELRPYGLRCATCGQYKVFNSMYQAN
jgi:hypothetical protein